MSFDLSVSYVALEQFEMSLRYSDATEALGLLARITDGFIRIVNTFKTSLKGIWREFKRSELKAYHDSNMIAINRFLRAGIFDANIQVPIPSGMKVTYLQAIMTLADLYKTLDIEETMSLLKDYFSHNGQDGTLVSPTHTTQQIDRLTKDHVEKTLRTVFTADRTEEVSLHRVIPTFAELVVIDRRVLEYDAIFQRVERICSDLDGIETTIDALVTRYESLAGTVDKNDVDGLYRLVRTASVQLDMYGVLLAEMQRVEHNFVIILRRLVTSA